MPEPQLGERTGGYQSPRARISEGAVALFRRYAGRGPTQAQTTVRGDLVVVVLREMLTESEKRLVDAGHADDVLRLRDACQRAMRYELTALVEEHVGRKVAAFSSHNLLEPDIAVELFILDGSAPKGDGTSP